MLKKLNNLLDDLNKDGFKKEAGAVEDLVGMLSKALGGAASEKDVEEEDLEENSKEQIKFHGIETDNFDLCPGAVKAFSYLDKKINSDSKEFAVEALKTTDNLLGLERGIIEKEEASKSQLEEAISMALKVASKTGIISHLIDEDLSDEFSFLGMHIQKIADYAK